MPADGPDDVRHKGAAILFQALALNWGNLSMGCSPREEDATMKSGKFDEELSRMNDMVNILTPCIS